MSFPPFFLLLSAKDFRILYPGSPQQIVDRTFTLHSHNLAVCQKNVFKTSESKKQRMHLYQKQPVLLLLPRK